jgi:hypothetical protein
MGTFSIRFWKMGLPEEKFLAVPSPTWETQRGTVAGARGRKFVCNGRARAVLTGKEKPCWMEV